MGRLLSYLLLAALALCVSMSFGQQPEAARRDSLKALSSVRLTQASKLFQDYRSRPRAGALARQALRAAAAANDTVLLSEACLLVAKIDSANGDYAAAYRQLLRHKALSEASLKTELDGLRNNEKEREVTHANIERRLLDLERVESQQRELLRLRGIALAAAVAGLAALLLLLFLFWRAKLRSQRVLAELRSLNALIGSQKAAIEEKNRSSESMNEEMQRTLAEVNRHRDSLSEQNRQIEDSFLYASRIQRAILPDDRALQQHLPKHFIAYLPRDIVSGDFYWLARLEGRTVLAVVDCTGHGVPGAFMSMVGTNLLYQIVEEHGITKPHAILASLDRRINLTLRQTESGDPGDGMDLALAVIHDAGDDGSRKVEFAGAARPLFVLRSGQVDEFRSGTLSCGGYEPAGKSFPTVSLDLQAGDRMFLLTDGVTDQFGKEDKDSPVYRKMGRDLLKRWLVETASLPIEDQGAAFEMFFHVWKGDHRQIDDVLMIGLEL